MQHMFGFCHAVFVICSFLFFLDSRCSDPQPLLSPCPHKPLDPTLVVLQIPMNVFASCNLHCLLQDPLLTAGQLTICATCIHISVSPHYAIYGMLPPYALYNLQQLISPLSLANSGWTYIRLQRSTTTIFVASCCQVCMLTHLTHIQSSLPTQLSSHALIPLNKFADAEAQGAFTRLPIRPRLGPRSRCGPFQHPEDGTFALITPQESRFEAPGVKYNLARQSDYRPTSCLALDGQAQYGESGLLCT